MSKEARKEILDEAAKAVLHDRTTTHGGVEDNFATIATYWTNHLQARGLIPSGKAMESRDVAVMLAMLKAARLAQSFDHRDNWVDMAGYAACGGGLVPKPTQFNAPPLCSACHTLHHVGVPCSARALLDQLQAPPIFFADALSQHSASKIPQPVRCPTCGHAGRECMCKKNCTCGCLGCSQCYPDAT